jgi:hypothetical protein
VLKQSVQYSYQDMHEERDWLKPYRLNCMIFCRELFIWTLHSLHMPLSHLKRGGEWLKAMNLSWM